MQPYSYRQLSLFQFAFSRSCFSFHLHREPKKDTLPYHRIFGSLLTNCVAIDEAAEHNYISLWAAIINISILIIMGQLPYILLSLMLWFHSSLSILVTRHLHIICKFHDAMYVSLYSLGSNLISTSYLFGISLLLLL